jgi:hypothetical protein
VAVTRRLSLALSVVLAVASVGRAGGADERAGETTRGPDHRRQVVLLGRNRLVGCESVLTYKGMSIVTVRFDPLRVELITTGKPPSLRAVRVDREGERPGSRVRTVATPRSFAILWGERPLAVATLLDAETALLKMDLRPLGLPVYDDDDGLHIGKQVFAGNVVNHPAAAINLED